MGHSFLGEHGTVSPRDMAWPHIPLSFCPWELSPLTHEHPSCSCKAHESGKQSPFLAGSVPELLCDFPLVPSLLCASVHDVSMPNKLGMLTARPTHQLLCTTEGF